MFSDHLGFGQYLPVYNQWSHFIPPENTGKHLVLVSGGVKWEHQPEMG